MLAGIGGTRHKEFISASPILGRVLVAVVITAALFIALAAVVWSLWVRRDTWRNPWERTASSVIVLHASALILTAPSLSRYLGPPLHTLTRLWNLDDFIGHSCYIASACAILAHGLTRLTPGVATHFQKAVLTYFLPFMALRLVLFANSVGARTPTDDFMALPEGPWLAAYWCMLCGTTAAILLAAAYVFWILFQHPTHRRIAGYYLTFCILGAVVCVARIVQAVIPGYTPGLSENVWLGVCASVIGFAFTFGASWYRRSRRRDLVAV